MKYWNKKKRSRKNWTAVNVRGTIRNFTNLKIWCQRHPSKGRFYREGVTFSDPGNQDNLSIRFSFEHEEDAIAFRLAHR